MAKPIATTIAVTLTKWCCGCNVGVCELRSNVYMDKFVGACTASLVWFEGMGGLNESVLPNATVTEHQVCESQSELQIRGATSGLTSYLFAAVLCLGGLSFGIAAIADVAALVLLPIRGM